MKNNLLGAVIAGVLVFVCSQITLKLFIEPAISLRGVIGEVCSFVLQNHAKISNASESDELSRKAKELSAKLMASTFSILCYSFIRILFRLPKKQFILEASKSLNIISHVLYPGARQAVNSTDCIQKVNEEKDNLSKLLGIPTNYE
ncbi:MAG: hypothetical protein F6K42_17625 [Leptolyngbya sp. SIO1D8]|nr:hypothetical protein [Leptolyngbya sp. SIO1D8]